MLRRRNGQRGLWEVLQFGDLEPEKQMDPRLRRIDEVLKDDALVDTVLEAMRGRFPQSGRRGRRGTPAEVALRMLVLKHLKNWSYEQLEWEVKGNLVYRHFCRIDAGKVPDAKTMVRLGQLLEGPALRSVFERIVQLAVARRVTRGRKMRVDTTVVETPIRYPSDSRLCEDVAQGVCREIERLRSLGVTAPSGFRNVRRSVTRRVREITHVSRRPMGVRCAAVPKPGHRSPSWLKRERQRSFRKARAWRAAGEARIARLKNTFARREPGAKSQGRGIAREPRTRKASPYRVGRSLKDNREIARLHEAPEEAGVVLAS